MTNSYIIASGNCAIKNYFKQRAKRFALTGAAVVVVVAGLRAAAPVLLPVLVALFLALLCLPAMRRLRKLGLPNALAIAAAVLLATAAVLLVSFIVARSMEGFQEALPHYRERLTETLGGVIGWLNAHGLDVRADAFATEFDSAWVLQYVGDTASALLSVLSSLVLVLTTTGRKSGLPRQTPDRAAGRGLSARPGRCPCPYRGRRHPWPAA